MTKSRKLSLIIKRWAKSSNDIDSPTFLDDLDEIIAEVMEQAYERGITCLLDGNGHGESFEEYNNNAD